MRPSGLKLFAGEFIGTFVLVFMGCGSLAINQLFGPLPLELIALCWGAAVFCGIVFSMHLSGSHLNPAVSIGFLIIGQLRMRRLGYYLMGQFVGAFAAAIALFAIVNPFLVYRMDGWMSWMSYLGFKGAEGAKIFACFYANTNALDVAPVNTTQAFIGEAIGTAFLMAMIIYLSQKLKKPMLIAAGIALTLALLIYLIGPYTMAGFNPARDLSPRFMISLMGWESFAFWDPGTYQLSSTVPGFSADFSQSPTLVYVLAPIAGTTLVGLLDRLLNRKSY